MHTGPGHTGFIIVLLYKQLRASQLTVLFLLLLNKSVVKDTCINIVKVPLVISDGYYGLCTSTVLPPPQCVQIFFNFWPHFDKKIASTAICLTSSKSFVYPVQQTV